jgi:hypothetical protein
MSMAMPRRVRGSFFAEYVRMLRRRKDVNWHEVLDADDLVYLTQHIEAGAWYPMESFERLGLAILAKLEGATLDAVHLWGRYSAHHFVKEHGDLVKTGDAVDTMMRLKVQRETLFDFPAFDVPSLIDGEAHVIIAYGMSDLAEEAACHQTMGFCEGILSLAGAGDVRGHFTERSWSGEARTLLVLQWR